MKHIVSHILYGLSLFLLTFAFYVTMKERSIGLLQCMDCISFLKKRCIGNPMICQFTLFMACDQLLPFGQVFT